MKTDLKPQMLKALADARGIVTIATKAVGISRRTHYEWLESDAEYKQAVEDINEDAIDFVESNLLNRIESGDTTAIIFYLKTRAKARGYTEKSEPQMIIEQPLFGRPKDNETLDEKKQQIKRLIEQLRDE